MKKRTTFSIGEIKKMKVGELLNEVDVNGFQLQTGDIIDAHGQKAILIQDNGVYWYRYYTGMQCPDAYDLIHNSVNYHTRIGNIKTITDWDDKKNNYRLKF